MQITILAKKLLPAGTHLVNLSVVTQEGCVDDTTRSITVYTKPPADFQITPTSLCVGTQLSIADTSSASGRLHPISCRGGMPACYIAMQHGPIGKEKQHV